MSVPVLHVVLGPERHGVTRHALDLLQRDALAGHARHRVESVDGPDAAWAALADLPEAALTHLHLTDHLLAPTAGECAALVTRLASARAVSLTLHDLPQRADGEGRYERRRDAYAAMAQAARGVVVASEHERSLLRTALDETGRSAPPVEVIPLPMPVGAPRPDLLDTARRDLVVFGYLYPGKGHADALEALADLPVEVGLVAAGEVSPGHEHLVRELRARAGELGRRFDVTGYLDDGEVTRVLQRASVPVAPHRHVSASGSINSWLAVGRRPLVAAGPYTDELDRRVPGAVLRYGPGLPHPDLAAAARHALDHPETTFVDVTGPVFGLDDAARRLAACLDAWSAS